MSTLTTRLGLKKPQDSDAFLTSDFDANYDLIDSYPGVWVCTQSTRPAWGSAQAGQLIFCTDTRTPYEWTGTAFKDVLALPAAWALSSTMNTLVTPPGGGANGTTSYTVGTLTSTRSTTVACFVALDFEPPPEYVIMNLSLGVTVGGQVLAIHGGSWAQAAFTVSGATHYPTSAATSVVGWGLVNLPVGASAVSVQVTLADVNVTNSAAYGIMLVDASVYITSINTTTQ